MEGKKSDDPRRKAYNEYLDSKDKARFTSIAQKLAQHINHLAQDKNTRIRWIWELIQNAKDVPNEFGRCRIRIEIKDDKLIFAHNGDPFRVSDLQSLVAQYSSKAEENKINTETTGKYGTGFIVTYILSKKVRIKGLLTMKTNEQRQSTKNQQGSDQDEVQLSTQEQIATSRSRLQQMNKFNTQMEAEEQSIEAEINIQEDVQKIMPKKSKLKNFEGGSLYQRFDILLDREYKDRDKQLVNKLMMTQRNLMEDLLKNEPEPKWQRKEGQLNTQFIYEDIDQAANKMINESMACLKQLFPYALLFNPKLFQIQVIDKRTYKSIKKFGIKRIDQESFNGIKIFNANILEEGEQQARKFSLAYMADEDTYSIVAMPLEIKENSIKLLQVNNKLPKMFKQFPLIGCKDIGFNFVFTSKRFYPNQNRSNLLLQQIEGRDSRKTKANWEALTSIFQKGLQLYKSVARIIDDGQQNLFIISLENQFADFPNKNMKQIFRRYQEEVSQLKCIQFSNKSYGSIQELTFPIGVSENKKIQPKNYCSSFNSVFSIVLGQETTLSDEKYKKLYPKLAEYYKTWSEYTMFADLNDCISQFSKFKFQELLYKVKQNKQAALKIVQKIYEFLSLNHPNYLIPLSQQQNQQQQTNKSNKKRQQLKFILTNNQQFRDINQNLKIKKQLPPAYEEVGQQLNININEFTIHDRFAKYFSKIKAFGITEMLNRFENYFFSILNLTQKNCLVLLGRFLTTFNIKSQAFEVAIKLKHLQNSNKAFEIKDKKNILLLDNRLKKQYQLLFQVALIHHINKLMNESLKLQTLMLLTIYPSNQKQKAIQWLNTVFKLQDSILREVKSPEFIRAIKVFYIINQKQLPTRLIDRNLSLSHKLVFMQDLKVFGILRDKNYFKGNYPDSKDIDFYEKMREIYNRRTKNYPYNKYVYIQGKKTMQDHTLHESIQYKLPTATTFKNQFGFIVDLYHYKNSEYPSSSILNEQKIEILNYIYYLRQSAIKNRQWEFKINVFQELQKIAYFEFASLTKRIQKTQNQIYAFILMRNQQELSAAREIAEQFGSMKQALAQIKTLKLKNQQTKK